MTQRERTKKRYIHTNSSLSLLHGRHPFYLSPLFDQEILHVLINLPVGSTRADAVITESRNQFRTKNSTNELGDGTHLSVNILNLNLLTFSFVNISSR